jgi:hypothetical protein
MTASAPRRQRRWAFASTFHSIHLSHWPDQRQLEAPLPRFTSRNLRPNSLSATQVVAHVRRWLRARGRPSRLASGDEHNILGSGLTDYRAHVGPGRNAAGQRGPEVDAPCACATTRGQRADHSETESDDHTQPSKDEPDTTVPHTMRSNQPHPRTFSFKDRRCRLGRSRAVRMLVPAV